MTYRIQVTDPDSGEVLGYVAVCDAHGEAGCLTFGPCSEEPVAYDGFGAPIYQHQEAPMPTELPPGFKGTGKRSTPNPEIPVRVNIPEGKVRSNPDDGLDEARDYDDRWPVWLQRLGMTIFGGLTLALTVAVVYAVVGCLLALGNWAFGTLG